MYKSIGNVTRSEISTSLIEAIDCDELLSKNLKYFIVAKVYSIHEHKDARQVTQTYYKNMSNLMKTKQMEGQSNLIFPKFLQILRNFLITKPLEQSMCLITYFRITSTMLL